MLSVPSTSNTLCLRRVPESRGESLSTNGRATARANTTSNRHRTRSINNDSTRNRRACRFMTSRRNFIGPHGSTRGVCRLHKWIAIGTATLPNPHNHRGLVKPNARIIRADAMSTAYAEGTAPVSQEPIHCFRIISGEGVQFDLGRCIFDLFTHCLGRIASCLGGFLQESSHCYS